MIHGMIRTYLSRKRIKNQILEEKRLFDAARLLKAYCNSQNGNCYDCLFRHDIDVKNFNCDNIYSFEWNGAAQGGQPLSTGVYLVRAYIEEDGVVSSSKTGKIVVINNK